MDGETTTEGQAADESVESQATHCSFEALAPSDVFRLSRAPGQSAFKFAYDPEPAWHDDRHRQEVERGLVRSFAPRVIASLSPAERRSLAEESRNLRETGPHPTIGRLLRRLALTVSPQAALDESRRIWEDRLPPLVASMLVAVAPEAERRTLAEGALAAATELNAAQRATVLCFVLPHLEPPASANAVEDLDALISQTSFNDVMRLLQQLDDEVDRLPRSILLLFVQRLLHSAETRKDLLASLQKVLPVLRRLAGGSVGGIILRVIREAAGSVR
jgi:hypothetical protein